MCSRLLRARAPRPALGRTGHTNGLAGRSAGKIFTTGHYNKRMLDDLLRYRSEFPILERCTYMISNSLGAMPRPVYDALHADADVWASRGVRAWEERWWMLVAEVGN